jgi:hypothetical protein
MDPIPAELTRTVFEVAALFEPDIPIMPMLPIDPMDLMPPELTPTVLVLAALLALAVPDIPIIPILPIIPIPPIIPANAPVPMVKDATHIDAKRNCFFIKNSPHKVNIFSLSITVCIYSFLKILECVEHV